MLTAPAARARSIAASIEGFGHALAPGRLVDHDVLDPGAQAGRDAEQGERERADDLVAAAGEEQNRGRRLGDLVEFVARRRRVRRRQLGRQPLERGDHRGCDLVTLDDLDGHAASVEIRDGLRGRRPDVLRARADDAVVGGLLEDVGAPADHPD